jgi:hypothetical protein
MSRIRCLNRSNDFGAIVRLMSGPAVKLNPRNFRSCEHVVPLSAMALDVPAKLPKNSELVFSVDGISPIGGFGYFKDKLDEAVPLRPWTLHDLRRTARSLMSRCGISRVANTIPS